MKVLGITAEYDPFHNGHKYHLKRAKEAVSPDVSICVMSGDITQRGHLAVLDKWCRSSIAVGHGLDMVLELPFAYAVSPAAGFAGGAVDILAMAGSTDIAFGCEAEDPEKLLELADLQIKKSAEIEEEIRREMKSGISYVKARQVASTRILGEELTILSLTPNNILAIEYLKRMKYWEGRGVSIRPVPIIRKGSGYNESNELDMAGGSAIRTMIDAGWDVSKYLPYDQSSITGDASPWIDTKAAKARMLEQLKGTILRSSPKQIGRIRFVGEGIENKLIKEVADAGSYDVLLERMTSKRYTTSTIRRMLICVLMGINKDEADEITGYGRGREDEDPSPVLYGRILALGEKGRRLIAGEKEKDESAGRLPFISNANRTEGLGPRAKKSLEMDIKGADLYNLLTGRNMYENSDHRKKPAIL